MNDRQVDTNTRRDIAVDAILISNGPREVKDKMNISHKLKLLICNTRMQKILWNNIKNLGRDWPRCHGLLLGFRRAGYSKNGSPGNELAKTSRA